MMNKQFFIGNLTKDVETKMVKEDKTLAVMNIAVNDSFDQDAEPLFLTIECWKGLATAVSKLTKGAKVLVETRMRANNYENADGKKVYGYKFVAESVEFLSPKKESQPN